MIVCLVTESIEDNRAPVPAVSTTSTVSTVTAANLGGASSSSSSNTSVVGGARAAVTEENADDDTDEEYEDSDDDTIEEGDEDDDDEPYNILCSKDVQLTEKTQPNAGYVVCVHVLWLCVCACMCMCVWAGHRAFTICLRHMPIDSLSLSLAYSAYCLISDESRISY